MLTSANLVDEYFLYTAVSVLVGALTMSSTSAAAQGSTASSWYDE